ncbi:unnamed protein product, partial [Laminaria digitata]
QLLSRPRANRPRCSADDEHNAARPLEMDVEDDATTPPQLSRNPDLLSSLESPPETRRDKASARGCGSPPPGETRPASPGLSGSDGFSDFLDPCTGELDAEGTKPAGFSDGDRPADKAERKL